MVQPVVTFHRSISLGSYGGLKLEVIEAFSKKIAFLEKTTPLRENFQKFVRKGFIATQMCADFVKFGRPDRCNRALLTSQNRQALPLSLLRGSRPKFVRASSRQYTVCTRVQVDPHISRPSFLAVKKMSRPAYKSTPCIPSCK